MNKKIISVFILALIFSCTSVVAIWFPNYSFIAVGDISSIDNTEIVVGSILEVDGFTITELPSEIGGLISSFENQITKILSFFSAAIHREESTEAVETFELFAFPVGSNPQFDLLSYGQIFAESENVALEGHTEIPNVWITNSVATSSPGDDAQTLTILLNVWMSSSCGNILITSTGADSVNYDLQGPIDQTAVLQDCDATCPSEIEMKIAFPGIVFDEMRWFNNPYNMAGKVLVLRNQGSLVGFLIDKDCDSQWHFADNIVEGKSVLSHESHTLLLSEPGFFDIYVVV